MWTFGKAFDTNSIEISNLILFIHENLSLYFTYLIFCAVPKTKFSLHVELNMKNGFPIIYNFATTVATNYSLPFDFVNGNWLKTKKWKENTNISSTAYQKTDIYI